MTMSEFKSAYLLPVIGSQPDEESYDETYVAVGNVILRECFDLNNGVRQKNGLEPLAEFVELTEDDEIPYELEVMINCVVYGWGALLIIDDTDDEVNKYGILADKYETAKAKYGLVKFATVVSEYGI